MRPPVVVPLQPLQPLSPLQPLKRLKMQSLPFPYEDVFEGVHGTITRLIPGPDLNKFDFLEGAQLVAADQTYLGKISRNKFDGESISNPYSIYGNPFDTLSIFNKFGTYGNPYSQLSPFNSYSNTPPKIIKDSKFIGYLTANRLLQNRVDINEFLFWLGRGD